MTIKPYTPQAGSLPSQVVGFFANNRDEYLTLEDISDKFSAARGSIHTNLRMAVDAGLLVRDRDLDGDYIYKRGPRATALAPKGPGVNIDAAHSTITSKAAGVTRYAPKMLDIDTLVVDDDVPFMQRQPAQASKWTPLFEKLKKRGQSVAIPGHCKAALAAAARKLGKQMGKEFRVATTGPGEARVWRVS